MLFTNLLMSQIAEKCFEKGVIKYNTFDYPETIWLLDSAVILNPGYYETFNTHGFAKGYLQDYKDAIVDCYLTNEINPKFRIVYHNRGISKNNNVDRKRAFENWNKALDMNIKDVKVLLGMFCRVDK